MKLNFSSQMPAMPAALILMLSIPWCNSAIAANLNDVFDALNRSNQAKAELESQCRTWTRECDSKMKALEAERREVLSDLSPTGSFRCQVVSVDSEGDGRITNFDCKNEFAQVTVSNVSVSCSGADSMILGSNHSAGIFRYCYTGDLFPEDTVTVSGTITNIVNTNPVKVYVGGYFNGDHGPVVVTLE